MLSPAQAATRRALKRFMCTAEHLLPRSQGGKDRASNIKAACLFCNQTRHRTKAPKTPQRHRQHVQQRLRKGKWHPQTALRILSAMLDVAPP